MASKVTLKKIAESLGMSTATVSKALKDYPDISSATKQKVKELAEALHYKPNSFAQSLRTKQSKVIGLIIPEIVHHFFANIIKGVIDSAAEKGYLVIVLQSDESYENEKEQIQMLVDKNVDGILLSLADTTIQFDHLKQTINDGTRVVLYDKISKVINCSKVIINDQKAAFNATKFLIDSGCRKIAHVCGPLRPQTTIDRYLGYKKALEKNGLEFDSSLVFTIDRLTYEEGYETAAKIITSHPDVDGVFAFTDLVATGVLTGLKELGVSVPDQISIIGFSNWFLTKITSPKLTTVNQPGYDMGCEAFRLLHDEIVLNKEGTKIEHQIVEIPTEIVVRDSVKKNVVPNETDLS